MHTHAPDADTPIARILRNADWLPLGAILTEHVNNWAEAHDLVLYIGEDGAADLGENAATAFYDPRTREIEVSAPFAFGEGIESWKINFDDCKTKRGLTNYPVLGGLLLHESMHAKHSTWLPPEVQKALVAKYGRNRGTQAMKIYTLLEETRIERLGVKRWPSDKGFLRASSRKLATPGKGEGPLNIVSGILLILTRTDIGSLTARDTHKLRKEIIKQMNTDVPEGDAEKVLTQISEAANLFHRQSDYDPASQDIMLVQTKKVYDLLAPYMPSVSMPDDGHGEEGEGEGQDDGEGEQQVPSPDGQGGEIAEGQEGKGNLGQEATEAANEALDTAETGGAKDVWNEAARQEADRQAEEAARQAKQQKENEKVSQNTFERSSGGGDNKTKSRIVNQREATAEEREATVTFNSALVQARYRDRKASVTMDYVPPGRLRTAAAMRDESIRWAGGVAGTTQMFKGKRRTHVAQPDLTVGIMGDISGSMSGTMEGMAVATWVMANSVNRIQGSTCAAVYYGESVFPTLWPGERLEKVTKYAANDGYEEFNAAFQALDGKLNLLNGRGVRLLVITSDGNYRSHEEAACRKWLAECGKKGVGVLWLGLKQGRAESFVRDAGAHAEFVDISGGVVGATSAISSAAIRALRAAR